MKSREIVVEYPIPLAARQAVGTVRGAVQGFKSGGLGGAVSGATAGFAQGLGDQRVANTSARVYSDWARIVKNLPLGTDYTTELVNYIDQRFSKYVEPGKSQVPVPTIANATDYRAMQQYINARTQELWTKTQPVPTNTGAAGSTGASTGGNQPTAVDQIKQMYGALSTGEKNQLQLWLSSNP